MEVEVGAPGGAVEFVVQVNASEPQQPLDLVLPGSITHGGDSFLLGVIPIVRLVGRTHAATLYFAETDGQLTDQALDVISRATNQRAPQRFELLVTTDLTVGEIMSGSQKGNFTRDAPTTARMRAQVQFRGRVASSADFPCLLATRLDVPVNVVEDRAEHHLFDCHSDWWWGGRTGRYTICHGPCSELPGIGPKCATSDGKQWDTGWHWCWC